MKGFVLCLMSAVGMLMFATSAEANGFGSQRVVRRFGFNPLTLTFRQSARVDNGVVAPFVAAPIVRQQVVVPQIRQQIVVPYVQQQIVVPQCQSCTPSAAFFFVR